MAERDGIRRASWASASRVRKLLAGVALVVALLVMLRAHLFFLRPYALPVSNDEGYLAAMTLRMARGHWLPYVDGVSQRGPLLYWVTALAMALGGLWSWVPLRVLGLLLGLGTLGLSFALAAELFAPLAGGMAALIAAYFLGYELSPWDGIGVNGEPLAVLFALAACWVTARVQMRDPPPRVRLRHAVAAGVLVACAALSKQMFALHALPIAGWLWLGPQRRPAAIGERRRELLGFVLGGAGPVAGVVLRYAIVGELGTFLYYFQGYGRQIFMAPVTSSYALEKFRELIDQYYLGIVTVALAIACAVGSALGATLAASGPGKLRRTFGPWFALAQTACALAGACFTLRFFPHYFVQFVPFAAVVLGALAAQRFAHELRGDDRFAAAGSVLVVGAAIVLLLVSSSALGRHIRARRETDRWYGDPAADPVVRYVREHTGADESIFVWGFRAEIYLSARRYPASRFVYTVYPAGVVPWFQATRDEEEARVVPGSREQLLDDLEHAQPELVIDAGRSMSGRYMYNYPLLRRYLDRHYCFMRYVDGEPVYRRRRGASCPPADY